MKNYIQIFMYAVLLRFFLRWILGIQFKVAHHLKNDAQFIVVANHNSHLDALVLMASLPARLIPKVKPVAACDYFGKTRWSTLCCTIFLNILLINRRKVSDRTLSQEKSIDAMLNTLDKGYSLILFPEGTRGEAEKIQEFKKGIAILLLKRSHISYLPAFLSGLGKILPKGSKCLVPYQASVNLGNLQNISSDSVGGILEEVKSQIFQLK